jgi:hypothetical protein
MEVLAMKVSTSLFKPAVCDMLGVNSLTLYSTCNSPIWVPLGNEVGLMPEVAICNNPLSYVLISCPDGTAPPLMYLNPSSPFFSSHSTPIAILSEIIALIAPE